jgi:AcrR family transcriptional regulator
MREKIIQKASDLFLSYGFKSVTMDDIANNLGISKKTIYQNFENKTKLVEATAMYVFEFISNGINCICDLNNNPIEEIYDIKNFVMLHLKDEKSSPQYQLQKYYPRIFKSLKIKQFDIMQDCVTRNLQRGINQNLYRENIEIDIIWRIYLNSMMALKDKELFPDENFSINTLMENFIEYHLRGICTQKGLDVLNKILQTK